MQRSGSHAFGLRAFLGAIVVILVKLFCRPVEGAAQCQILVCLVAAGFVVESVEVDMGKNQ